jgi:hypothetical protein
MAEQKKKLSFSPTRTALKEAKKEEGVNGQKKKEERARESEEGRRGWRSTQRCLTMQSSSQQRTI